TAHRRHREPGGPEEEDPAPPVAVTEGAADEDEGGQGDQVGRQHPLQPVDLGPEVLPDGGQGHVDHRGVQHGHPGAEDGGQEDPSGRGRAVPDLHGSTLAHSRSADRTRPAPTIPEGIKAVISAFILDVDRRRMYTGRGGRTNGCGDRDRRIPRAGGGPGARAGGPGLGSGGRRPGSRRPGRGGGPAPSGGRPGGGGAGGRGRRGPPPGAGGGGRPARRGGPVGEQRQHPRGDPAATPGGVPVGRPPGDVRGQRGGPAGPPAGGTAPPAPVGGPPGARRHVGRRRRGLPGVGRLRVVEGRPGAAGGGAGGRGAGPAGVDGGPGGHADPDAPGGVPRRGHLGPAAARVGGAGPADAGRRPPAVRAVPGGRPPGGGRGGRPRRRATGRSATGGGPMTAVATPRSPWGATGGPPQFDLPAALEAGSPAEARGLTRDAVRMLVAHRGDGSLVHATFSDLPRFLAEGDLVVVNTSGTLAASIPAAGPDGRPLAVHLSTRLPA